MWSYQAREAEERRLAEIKAAAEAEEKERREREELAAKARAEEEERRKLEAQLEVEAEEAAEEDGGDAVEEKAFDEAMEDEAAHTNGYDETYAEQSHVYEAPAEVSEVLKWCCDQPSSHVCCVCISPYPPACQGGESAPERWYSR